MTQITIVPYNPLWPQAFEQEARAITSAMGNNLSDLHHIGSTSIPGMHAKLE